MDSNHLGGLQPTNSPKSVYLELAARLLPTVGGRLSRAVEFHQRLAGYAQCPEYQRQARLCLDGFARAATCAVGSAIMSILLTNDKT